MNGHVSAGVACPEIISDTASLADRVRGLLGAIVPSDWQCVGITDPTTSLVTMVQNCKPVGPPEVYLASELFVPDVNKFAWLAEQPIPVGVLSEVTGGDLESSYRYRNALRPSGIRHELRAALVIDGACWGYLVLLRSGEMPDFSPAEVRHVGDMIPGLAAELRAGLLERANAEPRSTERAMAVLSGDESLSAVNSQAAEIFERISALHPAVRLDLPVPIAVLVASLQAQESSDARRALVSLPEGGWLVVEGYRVYDKDGDARVVVSMEPAAPAVLAPLLCQARGMTEREIAVAQCVLRGLSNAEIAERLGISVYTVQDHLKSAFAKTRVRSRREFVHAVLPGADLMS